MPRVTTTEAALLTEVSPATIRQWVARGHLIPVGKRGRENVYEIANVWEAELTTHQNDRTGKADR